MKAARLLRLADYLETVPRDRFDMNRWVGDSWGGKQDLSCGTKACAMGHAATMPFFRKLGLKLSRFGVGTGVPAIRGVYGLSAAVEIFGIEWAEADYLFGGISLTGSHDHSTPKQVARRIRQFVKRGGPPDDWYLS